jgi:hypothetical protein
MLIRKVCIGLQSHLRRRRRRRRRRRIPLNETCSKVRLVRYLYDAFLMHNEVRHQNDISSLHYNTALGMSRNILRDWI